jgi:endonuclease I
VAQTKEQRVVLRNKNRDIITATNREIRRLRKAYAVQEHGNKCAKCGQTYPMAVYDFHHVDPSVKELTIARMINLSYSRFKAEVRKCILLCANCHRVVHLGEEDADNPTYT